MVDKGDDDSYIENFLARAQEREAKLAKLKHFTKTIEASTNSNNNHVDVSYPPLSTLEEGDDESSTVQPSICTLEEQDEDERSDYNYENRARIYPSDQLNYSSDLSLECDQQTDDDNNSEIYRAKPAYANSSPEQVQRKLFNNPTNTIPFSQISPRKRALSIPQQEKQTYPIQQRHNDRKIEQPEPLHERQPEQKATSSQSLPEMSRDEQSMKDLQAKLERAGQTRTQLKKAVEASKYGCREHIEAARLLQIAETEHLNYTNCMAMYKSGMRKKSESLGSIKISSIRLKLSSRMRNELAEDGVNHYFFCIASCATEVKATELMDTNDIRRQDLKSYLQFKEKIAFSKLPPDFIVKVEVYELVTSVPLPKLLLRLTPSKKSKITPESNFKRVGSLKLTLADREIAYKNLTQWSKNEESKYLERECKFIMELMPEQLPIKIGMLHIRSLDSKGKPNWERYFVNLSQGLIRMWKSKQDALDDKKPNIVFELSDLCAEKVQRLTPDDELYRENSFVLYVYQQVASGEKDTLFQRVLKEDPKFKIVKHQIAAENKDEKDSWCSILDKSMNCYREWNGKTRVFTIDEVKEIFTE